MGNIVYWCIPDRNAYLCGSLESELEQEQIDMIVTSAKEFESEINKKIDSINARGLSDEGMMLVYAYKNAQTTIKGIMSRVEARRIEIYECRELLKPFLHGCYDDIVDFYSVKNVINKKLQNVLEMTAPPKTEKEWEEMALIWIEKYFNLMNAESKQHVLDGIELKMAFIT